MSFAKYLLQESKYLYNTDIKSVLMWVYNIFERVDEDRKRPRDPRPLLKINASMSDHRYDFHPLQMAMLSKDRYIITSPTHCRDYVNEAIRWHICGGSAVHSFHCNDDYEGELDIRTLRMVLLLDYPMHGDIQPFDGIKNGVRLANMYGRVAGWGPLRVIRARIPHTEEDDRECYVLIGDRNWQRTPQYISMLLLLIRVCFVSKIPEWISDAYALTGYWHEFLYSKEVRRPDNTDGVTYLAHSYHHMLRMVAHDRDIFPHNMLEGYHSKHDAFHGHSGLNALVTNDSIHPESASKLKRYYNTEVLKDGGRS